MRKIIGITGFAGNGKSTVANIIQNEYPNQWEIISSGDALKDVVSVLFNWPRHLLNGDTIESREFREQPDKYWSIKLNQTWTPRKALQWLGTDIIRNQLADDFWINITLNKINNLPENKNVLIPDVRFVNEINAIKSNGGYIWRVCLGQLPDWFKPLEALQMKYDNIIDYQLQLKQIIPNNLHQSEWEWIGKDKPDVIIHPPYKDLELLKKLVLEHRNILEK